MIFDLDDTLFDHRFSVRAGLAALRRDHSSFRSATLDELEHLYHELLEAAHPLVLAGRLDEEVARSERFRQLFEKCGEPIGRSEATQRARTYRRHYLRAQRLVPGAEELLGELRRDRAIVVLTNNRQREQETKLASVRATRLIDALVTAESVGAPKPDRRMFEAAVRAVGMDRSSCVVVGDSWSSDIQGACRAGIPAIWYNPRREVRPDQTPVAEITSWQPVARAAKVIRSLSGGSLRDFTLGES